MLVPEIVCQKCVELKIYTIIVTNEMSHIQYMDELIREYLLFRGFGGTLKAFDSDLKTDKDKGFRVDKIVDQLMQYVAVYDLVSLRELWSHMDQKMFSRLEHHFTAAVRKLESAVLKLYLVNAVVNNKPDKVTEFFNKYSVELQGQAEWKDWFMLPFVKNPEEVPCFAAHFTRQWQDTVLVSLHNFLSTIFQCMPLPTLASYEEDAARMKKLQEENDALRQRFAALAESARAGPLPEGPGLDVPPATELMDDFYVIALEKGSSGAESQPRTLKKLIRNIGSGLPGSPILARKASQPPAAQDARSGKSKVSVSPGAEDQQRRVAQRPQQQQQRPGLRQATSLPAVAAPGDTPHHDRDPSAERHAGPRQAPLPREPSSSAFLLLSQEDFSDHRAAICQCKFSPSGSTVLSSDVDGVIKLWTISPTPKTQATFVCKSSVTSVDWVKSGRYMMAGTKAGVVKLYDTHEKTSIMDIGSEAVSPLKDHRIVCVCCNPVENTFVCSAANPQGEGKLLLYDMKTRQLERSLFLDTDAVVANCCTFNHNGQLLVAGCSDGSVRIFDLRRSDCIDSWGAHAGPVESIRLTDDYTCCYTMGRDAKLCQRSLNQAGRCAWEASVPDCEQALGPGPHGQLFTFDPTGGYLLACGPVGGVVYKITPDGLERVLELGGHHGPARAVDWSFANQCAACATASGDGAVRVSMLLAP
ncbi:WD repeat-containing protein 91 [Bacillus rossius redtenbacheri]|uniref:WD repeat-containing protein 91 n=1 Tax=Bacillus rossius redtenbacheri TaxID=93214 RepID=UPI002FDC872B